MDKIANLISKTKNDKGKPKWWLWIVAALAIFVGLFIASAVFKRHQRELAKLRHEKRKNEILAANAKAEAEKAAHVKAAEEALERADKAARRIEIINENIKRIEERYAHDRAVASRIVWADLPRAEDG